MTPTHQDSAESTQAAPQRGVRADAQALLQPLAAALVTAIVFAGVYLAAFHAPVPHNLPVGVVGQTAVVSSVEKTVAARAPGEFVFRFYPDAAAASQAITRRSIYGAYLTGAGSPRLLFAGANGPAVTSTLTGTFGAVARANGQSLMSTDLVPLAPGDLRGLSTFYVIFGVVLAGFMFGQLLPQLKRRPAVPVVIATTVVFGLLAGLGVALLAGGTGFGAVPASVVRVVLLGGLLACSVAVATTALVRLVGAAGRLLAVVLLVILGGASSGAVLPPPYLPGWLHPLASVLPPGLAARALQGMSYFHNDGLVSGAIILSMWIAASAVVLLLVDWRWHGRYGSIK